MGTHRRLGDGQDAVGGNAHEVGPGREVVDHALHGDDRTAPGRQRAPDTLEQRRVDRDVALAVGGDAVQQRHVRDERRHQPDGAERRVDSGEVGVGGHRRIAQRTGDGRGQAARRRLQALEVREDRPVLDLDGTALVRLLEDRVRRVGREGVA